MFSIHVVACTILKAHFPRARPAGAQNYGHVVGCCMLGEERETTSNSPAWSRGDCHRQSVTLSHPSHVPSTAMAASPALPPHASCSLDGNGSRPSTSSARLVNVVICKVGDPAIMPRLNRPSPFATRPTTSTRASVAACGAAGKQFGKVLIGTFNPPTAYAEADWPRGH
jgi:hypothetical protein